MGTGMHMSEAMDWFFGGEGRGVWYKSRPSHPWSLVHSPSFMSGHLYVADDKHSIARRHFADGYAIGTLHDGIWKEVIIPNWEAVWYGVEPQKIYQDLKGCYGLLNRQVLKVLTIMGFWRHDSVNIDAFTRFYVDEEGRAILAIPESMGIRGLQYVEYREGAFHYAEDPEPKYPNILHTTPVFVACVEGTTDKVRGNYTTSDGAYYITSEVRVHGTWTMSSHIIDPLTLTMEFPGVSGTFTIGALIRIIKEQE